MKNLVFLTLLVILLLPDQATAGQNSITIFSYSRIGEEIHPDTSITVEQFKEHIKEIISNNYNVISLKDAIHAIKNEIKVPDKTIVITFDGGYKSAFKNAFPLLNKNSLPYTIFISTNSLSSNKPSHISWKELKKLEKNKLVTIGLHTASYAHLTNKTKEEITLNINNAISKYREETGKKADFFAYPFGENSQIYKKAVKNAGFEAALGQQSGIAYKNSDIMLLPRFPMTENYADINRFRLASTSKPLIVTDINPENNLVKRNNFAAGFTLDKKYKKFSNKLSCFASDIGKLDIEIIDNIRVEIRIDEIISENRLRINCTLPEKENEKTIWHWYGMLFTLLP